MRVSLVKAATTVAERMVARTMRADFAGVPEDLDRKDLAAAVQASASGRERCDASSAELVGWE